MCEERSMMPTHDFSYRCIGKGEKAPFKEWFKQIDSTPCVEDAVVTARHMMKFSFEQEIAKRTHFEFVVCLENEHVVGMIKHATQPTRSGTAIWIHYFAVLPSHQRRGIGKELLRQIQRVASMSGSAIFVRPEEPARKPLRETHFWQLPKRPFENDTYKWSDMPSQVNNDFPWSNEE